MSNRSFEEFKRAALVVAVVLGMLAFGWNAGTELRGGDASAQGSGFYIEAPVDVDLVVTADATGVVSDGWAGASIIGARLDCTEDSGTASLDVTIQRTIDGGAHWATVFAFTQLTASGGETKFYADVQAASAQMIGNTLRANYDVTGTGQYTCDLTIAGT